MTPRNLLFDIGGVIIDINKDNCVKAYKAIGMDDIDQLLDEYVQAGFFASLELGEISPEEFRQEIRKHIPSEVSDSQIDTAFKAFVTGLPRERLANLRRLRQHYKVYALSNTNPIIWSYIEELFQGEGLTAKDYFDGFVKSYEAHIMKPAPEIFRLAQKKLGIVPEETLFFDDSAENCRIAATLGFQTCHVPVGKDFMDCYDFPNLS